jgi:EpsI family protein
VDVAVRRDGDDDSSLLYDEVLTRSYRNSAGEVVMLSIAYGRRQRQEMKIHRPELCYAAQGFEVESSTPLTLLGGPSVRQLSGRAMTATSPGRTEEAVYWIRIGEMVSESAWQLRLYILLRGLAGYVPDGVLVRTSRLATSNGGTDSIPTQRRFIAELLNELAPSNRVLLVGADTDSAPPSSTPP